MIQPYFLVCDGQPVPGTGTPAAVYHLLHGTSDAPHLIVFNRSRRQPVGPLLETALGETHALEFHSEAPAWPRRLGRLARLAHCSVRPAPAQLAARIRNLGLRKAVLWRPGSDLVLYTAALLRHLPEAEVTLHCDDDPRVPLRASRNPVYRALGMRALAEVVARSSSRFAITSELAQRLGDAYGAAFSVLPIAVRDEHFRAALQAPIPMQPSSAELPVFLGGSTGPKMDASLHCLAEAFRRIENAGLRPRLLLGGTTSPEALHRLGFPPRAVIPVGWQPSREELMRQVAKAACAFVPYLFDARDRAFAETSFPSRIGDYWLAGPPVLVHAPAHAAVSRYFRATGLEFVCDRLDPEALAAMLVRIARLDVAEHQALQRRYLEIVRQRHLASLLRAQLLGTRTTTALAA